MSVSLIDEAYNQFSCWLEKQSFWIQDATFCIYNNKSIDENKIKEYAKLCLDEVNKKQPSFKKMRKSDFDSKGNHKNFSITEISDLLNVNALSNEANLKLNKNGVNVVYGLNGAGKSGFMRIFKHVSGSPHKETIQTNVFTKSLGKTQYCNFKVFEDGKESSIKINLRKKHNNSYLNLIDVFDTRISNEYISKTNSVSYQPFVFSVLSELVSIGQKIKDYFNNRIESITEISIEIPSDFSELDNIIRVNELKASDSIPQEVFVFDEKSENLILTLEKELDSENRNEKIERKKIEKESLKVIYNDLYELDKIYKNIKLEEIESNYLRKKKSLENSEKLFSENVEEVDKISLSSVEWKALWNNALIYYDDFIKEDTSKKFAQNESICPLCRQEITGDVYNRFSTINAFINGKYQQELNQAIDIINEKAKQLSSRKFSLERFSDTFLKLLDRDIINSLNDLHSTLYKLKNEKNELEIINLIKSIQYEDSLNHFKIIIANINTDLENLQNLSKVEVQKEKEIKLLELKANKWLYHNKNLIERIHSNKIKIKNYKEAIGLTRSNKITIQSNLMAEKLITDAYIKRFEKEMKYLAPNLDVKLEKAPSVKGRTPYKIKINTEENPNCRPEDILSEGEQRIVALATFFANASGRKDSAPIVIDDPISSLDVNYEKAATSRIVELAKERQVIVFTHRISLIKTLEDISKTENVQTSQIFIRSGAKEKGLLDFEYVYHGSVEKKLNGLCGELQRLKKLDPDSGSYENGLGNMCRKFRITVERSVEDNLLLGIVRRFDHKISTNGKIKKLARIKDADCKLIDDMMTKYSYYVHPQPVDGPIIPVDIEDLEKDVLLYKEFIKDLKSRMK